MFKKRCFVGLVGVGMLLLNSEARAQAPVLMFPSPDAIVAVVDGDQVAVRDLDAYSRNGDPRRLFLLNRQLQDPRRDLLETLNDDQLLAADAARHGTTVTRLLNERLKVSPVTDTEIRQTFARIAQQHPTVTFEEMLPLIRLQLQGLHRSLARARYLAELRRAVK